MPADSAIGTVPAEPSGLSLSNVAHWVLWIVRLPRSAGQTIINAVSLAHTPTFPSPTTWVAGSDPRVNDRPPVPASGEAGRQTAVCPSVSTSALSSLIVEGPAQGFTPPTMLVPDSG